MIVGFGATHRFVFAASQPEYTQGRKERWQHVYMLPHFRETKQTPKNDRERYKLY